MGMDKTKNEDDVTKSTMKFFQGVGISINNLPQHALTTSHDFLSQLLGTILKLHSVSRGRLTCSFTVSPPVANYYKGLHGGAVASIAEKLAIACARTIVTEEQQLFLGELSVSYLSATPINATLTADASVVRSGRNLTVVSIELRLNETKKLAYTAQATLFHLPRAKL